MSGQQFATSPPASSTIGRRFCPRPVRPLAISPLPRHSHRHHIQPHCFPAHRYNRRHLGNRIRSPPLWIPSGSNPLRPYRIPSLPFLANPLPFPPTYRTTTVENSSVKFRPRISIGSPARVWGRTGRFSTGRAGRNLTSHPVSSTGRNSTGIVHFDRTIWVDF